MPFKVLTAEMSHETNSFSLQETDELAFRASYILMGASWMQVEGMSGMSIMYSAQLRGQAVK